MGGSMRGASCRRASVRWMGGALIASALLAALVATAADETVVSGEWTVVYPKSPYATKGLQDGLSKMSVALCECLEESVGVKAVAVDDTKMPSAPGRRFFIGEKFAKIAGLMPADFKSYDWGIAEKNGDIYMFGRDRPGSNPKSELGCELPSALAAAKFMRDNMKVQFLMPGRIGREVPKLGRLAVPKGYFRRGGVKAWYQAGRYFDYPYNMANGIYGRGTAYTYGGHTYPTACPREKYRNTHPEYFAKDENGKPIWGDSPSCQAYCISNPEFRRLVYEEILRRYDAGADICQLGQNDGSAGLCRCRDCYNLYGTGKDWCEKLWLYHKEIAERIQKDRPGKLVHMMCYGDTANPPKTFKVFPDNVLIEICRYGEADMRLWDGYTVPHGFTYYIYNWSWYPILGFTPKRSISGLVEQVQRFHRYGMKGVYRCGYGEMFGMEGPAYWVFNHLVENPGIDVRGTLDQYYRGAFGAAAEPMKRFYEDLEEPLAEVEKRNSIKASDLVEGTIKRTKRRDPVDALATIYTPERIARMDAALKEAEQKQGLSERQARRLGLVRTEWDYVRNVGAIAYMYRGFRDHPTKEACFKILDALDERNAIVAKLFPGGKMRNVDGWPEIRLFGNPPLDQFQVNGRLGAPIKVPLGWDVARMRKYRIVPNESMTPEARAEEIKAAGLKPLTCFRMDKATRALPGVTYEPYPDGTGFRFGAGTNGHVRVTARVGAKQGLKPGKTYKISWLTRWSNVRADVLYHGYYFTAIYDDDWSNGKRPVLSEPNGTLHCGSSPGWIREATVMTVCNKPNFQSDFTFRFWRGFDGIAEVRDVTIEEVE